ncbi:MAG: hypothetical protein MUO40_06785, partial [Anaerolineaceae bacterium]|nr:hypothetical protein [Anaerolineaceae bacterium]
MEKPEALTILRVDIEKWQFTPTFLSSEDYIDKIYQNLLQPFLFTVKTWHKPGVKKKTLTILKCKCLIFKVGPA